VQEQPGPSTQPGGRLAGRSDPRVHHRRQLRAAPQQVGLAQAGTQVIPACDSLLHSGRVIGPGDLLGHLASQHLRGQGPYGDDDEHGDQREQRPGRPPGQSGHDPHRAGTQQRAGQVPAHPSQQHAELVGVVVDPVQDLTDRGLRQHGERLVHHRTQQVGAQPALGPVDDGRPRRATGCVKHCRPDQAQREQPHQPGGRPPGHPSSNHRAARLAQGCHRCGDQRPGRDRAPDAPPPEQPGVVLRDRLAGARRRTGSQVGDGHRRPTLRAAGCTGHPVCTLAVSPVRSPRRPDTSSPASLVVVGVVARYRVAGNPEVGSYGVAQLVLGGVVCLLALRKALAVDLGLIPPGPQGAVRLISSGVD